MFAGTGRKLALMLRKMCIILDKLGTAVLADPISSTHTGMMCVVHKYFGVYTRRQLPKKAIALDYTSWASQKTGNVSERSCYATSFTSEDLKNGSADPHTTLYIHKKMYMKNSTW